MNSSQYTYYDLIAHLVPGLVVLVVIKLLLDGLRVPYPNAGLEGLAAAGIGITGAYLAGIYLQSLSSACQDSYYLVLCHGKPSKILVEEHAASLDETATKIHIKRIADYYGIEAKPENAELIFTLAKDYVNSRSLGRAELILAVYTLMRGLLTFFLGIAVILAISLILHHYKVAWFATLDSLFMWKALAGMLTLLLLTCFRYANRAEAYAGEIIHIAGSSLSDSLKWAHENHKTQSLSEHSETGKTILPRRTI